MEKELIMCIPIQIISSKKIKIKIYCTKNLSKKTMDSLMQLSESILSSLELLELKKVIKNKQPILTIINKNKQFSTYSEYIKDDTVKEKLKETIKLLNEDFFKIKNYILTKEAFLNYAR